MVQATYALVWATFVLAVVGAISFVGSSIISTIMARGDRRAAAALAREDRAAARRERLATPDRPLPL
jgi:hypothetical protein